MTKAAPHQTETPAGSTQTRVHKVLGSPAVRIVIPLLIVALTVFILHDMASDLSWSAIKSDIAGNSWTSLLLALCATALSFFAISLYDVLGVQTVARGQVPLPIAGLAGAAGMAVSNLLGFSYLTGTTVRYRIYAAFDLDLGKVAGIIATTWTGFWLGLSLILGCLLVAHPVGLSRVLPISGPIETGLGTLLLLALGALFVWLARGGRHLAIGGFGFDLPGPKLAACLLAVAVVDILGAAATLYVLMPADLTQNFAYFFVVFVGAIAIGIVSSSPGGLGVFEASLIAGLGAGGRADVLAALILYRLIYSLLPFLLAVTGMACVWVISQRHGVSRKAVLAYRIVRPVVPIAAAGIALLGGTVLLVSGTLPADTARLGILRDILPLSFIEASHLAGSVAGLLLVVVSRGLYRKLHRAWVIAMALMILGLVASLAKGLDWEEALTMGLTIVLLGSFRSAFYRFDTGSVFRLNGVWIASLFGLILIVFWLGVFAHSNVQYRDALWWEFALHGDASRFLRASLVVAMIFAAILLNSLLNRRARTARTQAIPEAIYRLALQSENTEAQIALLGDKSFLISEDERAYIAYGDTGGSLISQGEPIGDIEAGRQLIWKLREVADKAGKRCAFYAVSPRYLTTYLDLGFSILKIGEVARVRLPGFTLDGPGKKSFRYASSRATREGYDFAVISKADVPAILPELRRVSDVWMEMKQGEEKAFSLGYFDETYLANFDHAVLRHRDTGRIVAFANLLQSGGKHELSLDLMRYDPAGLKVAMDALFAEMILWGAAQGFEWFSLGAAPFSGIESHHLASVWNRVGGFVYTHGEQFYHFEGLRSFKQKFDPEWTPHYLASPGGLAAPRILFEVNSLVSGGIKGLIQ